MDAYYERLILGAATIDELLSDEFETVAGENAMPISPRAASRPGADRRPAAIESLFDRRLQRDGWTIDRVRPSLPAPAASLPQFRPRGSATRIWIAQALQSFGQFA